MAIFGAAKSILSPHLVDWYTDIYTNVYGYDNLYKQVLSQFNTYLKEMVNSLQFTAFTNTILTIGVVLMLFYFFTDLTEKAAMNQLSTLQLGKSFCAALGTIFIMFHSKNIFIFLMNMVESLNDSLTIGARGHMIVSNILTNDITQLLLSRCVAEHFSVWAILGYTLTALLLMLVSLAVRMYILYFATTTDIVIIYVVVTRVLRVCANAVLSPIAICNFFDGSRHSDGMRFIKKTLAMCLQCSAIMIICAASTSLYSYITTDASRSSIFRGSAESHENVIKAKNSMVKSQSVNINALRDATEQARQNIGYVAYDDPDLHKHSATATPTTSNTYINAAYKLTQTKIAKIKEDKEEEYKKYEDTLGIQVFVRDKNGHYKYTKKGYAKLDDKYKIFNEEKMTTFMNMLLGGTNWLTMVFILVAKAGLIKKSNSICNVIVGV